MRSAQKNRLQRKHWLQLRCRLLVSCTSMAQSNSKQGKDKMFRSEFRHGNSVSYLSRAGSRESDFTVSIRNHHASMTEMRLP